MLPVVALATVVMCLSYPTASESLDGCQGPPSNVTSVVKPTLVFVWPCYVAGDTFLEEDPREVEWALDSEMSAQYRRLQEQVSTAGIDMLKALGALRLDFVSAKGRTERIRTTTVEWRGVLVHCPGRKVKRIGMAKAIVPDAEILDAVRSCDQLSVSQPSVPHPK